MSRVHVGSNGWLHPGWDERFYPEDIPPDWKLSYYANEFSATVVPQSIWYEQADDFAEMAEDLDDEFALYFQLKDLAPSLDDLRANKTQYAGNFRGYLVDFHDKAFSAEPASLFGELSEAIILPVDELVDEVSVGEASNSMASLHGNWAEVSSLNRLTNVILVDGSKDLRYQKNAFEEKKQIIRNDSDVLVLLNDEQPDVEMMRQLRIMLELMMIA